jgi:hypothetical protein
MQRLPHQSTPETMQVQQYIQRIFAQSQLVLQETGCNGFIKKHNTGLIRNKIVNYLVSPSSSLERLTCGRGRSVMIHDDFFCCNMLQHAPGFDNIVGASKVPLQSRVVLLQSRLVNGRGNCARNHIRITLKHIMHNTRQTLPHVTRLQNHSQPLGLLKQLEHPQA